MMKRQWWSVLLWLVLAGTLASTSPTQAQSREGMDWKTWKLGHLSRYIGSDQFEPILDDPYVREELKDIVGDSLPHLLRNMEVHLSSVNFSALWIILKGGMKDEVYREQAIIVIDLHNGMVHAGIFSNGHRTVFSVKEEYREVPPPLMDWIWWKELDNIKRSPPDRNFTFKKYQPR